MGPKVTVFLETNKSNLFYHDFKISYYVAGGRTVFFPGDNYVPDALLITEKLTTHLALHYMGAGYAFTIKPFTSKVSPYVSAGMSLDFLIKKREQPFDDILDNYDAGAVGGSYVTDEEISSLFPEHLYHSHLTKMTFVHMLLPDWSLRFQKR